MRRDHRKSDRVIIDAPPELARELFARLRSGLPETTTDAKGARWRLAGLNPYLRVLRYRPGDFCLGHPDGCFSPSANRRSFMTVLLYLNEGYRGGFTTIYDSAGRALPVAPRTGMAPVHHHRQPLRRVGQAPRVEAIQFLQRAVELAYLPDLASPVRRFKVQLIVENDETLSTFNADYYSSLMHDYVLEYSNDYRG